MEVTLTKSKKDIKDHLGLTESNQPYLLVEWQGTSGVCTEEPYQINTLKIRRSSTHTVFG